MSVDMVSQVTLQAPAKVNLYLKVLGRRDDGYHLLATLMQKIALCDTIEIRKTGEAGVRLSCPGSALPTDQDNIVYKAASLFFQELDNLLPENGGVAITLNKKIPVAAGLGGGSSDAAAVLCGLDTIFATRCSRAELAAMGERLGADVPLFVYDWPVAWATGIGECLTPAPGLTDGWMLLVNPGFPVSTKWVYENFALTSNEKKINLKNSHCNGEQGESSPIAGAPFQAGDLYNDLERVTIQRYPEIGVLKKQLREAGATGVLMSGSGPTVFGIFMENDLDKAQRCRDQFLKTYRQVYLVRPLATTEAMVEIHSVTG